MSITKVERLHDDLEHARDTVNRLRHKLIAAREDHGRDHPYVATLHQELQDALRAQDDALTAFSEARLAALHSPKRSPRRKPAFAS